VEGKGIQERGMEEVPENGKESSHSAHVNGMNECIFCGMVLGGQLQKKSAVTYINMTYNL
jgi:hypothetical protein